MRAGAGSAGNVVPCASGSSAARSILPTSGTFSSPLTRVTPWISTT